MSQPLTIPARRGKAHRVAKGETVRVINTHGEQVIDTWAFNAEDLTEFMSMEHSRAHMLKIIPVVGDILRTNRRRPILTLVEDTSGGIHDTIIAACDRHRYAFLGVEGHHDNCEDNLHAAMREIGLEAPETPSPLNLFMNIPVHPDRSVSFEAPVSTPGSFVRLKAEMDLVIAFSACPQDILPINGVGHLPTEAHFVVEP
ncbi:urea carboxylase-associated family protein [Jiella endophytica]|uniref:Urea carboxylase-associated family protein n=1 Tax=Jiella endophytica TaxID=2558362 RepID=A0A4Y8RK84_9HYPH|nr:urea carboxylase-associated family protein [Jiella endophytica]TFF23132.1 urea carboxylase-associated family protein [Jiella endophytica]